jgi:hypothetical protein
MRLLLAIRRRLLLCFLLLIPMLIGLSLVAAPNKALAANPTTMNFQGKVVNSDGTNPSNGTYTFIFRLYNTSSPTTATACGSDSSCLYEETNASITVTNGVFQVELGSGCTGGLVAANSCTKSSAIDFNSSNALYLTLKFNGDSAGFMSPLIHLTTVPYAFNSDKLGGIGASGFIQNNSGSAQSSSSFHIDGTGIADVQLQSPLHDTATSNGTLGIGTSNAGVITIGNTTNSSVLFNLKNSVATALQVKNGSGNELLTVDTSANNIVLGKKGSSGINGSLVFNTTNGSNTTITLSAASTGTSYSLTLPTTGPSTSQCLQTDSVTASQLKFAACAGGSGDNITVNGSAAADANFINVAASGTTAGTTWSLNTGTTPNQITLGISAASASQAGIVTNDVQTFGGAKTFSDIVAVQKTSTTAFQIQTDSGAANLLIADTTNSKIKTDSLEAINAAVVSFDNVITTVDSVGSANDSNSIAIGSDGFARISYYDSTGHDLKFAQCTNADCSTKNLTSVDTAGDVGLYSSIAIGSDGFARISYYGFTSGDLKFVQCTNADCSTKNVTTVDSTGNVGLYTSMAIGSDGFARISYAGTTDLRFVQCTNADCSTKNLATVVSTSGVTGTSMTLGSDGFGRIAYGSGGSFVRFAQCTNANCSSSNINTVASGNTGYYPSIVLGSDGFARISYMDNNSGSILKFSQCTNTACSSANTSTVDSTSNTGYYPSIVLGSDGFARISYYDVTNGNLKYARCTNASCSTNSHNTIDSSANDGWRTSIALGSDGFARISYYDVTNGNLKFIRLGGASGVGGVTGSSIGSVSAAYGQLYVKGINTDSFTLTGNTGATLFKNLQDSTTAFQIQNFAGTSLLIADTSNSKIKTDNLEAINAAVSTPNLTTTVDSTGDVGQYTSTAIGSDGFARISYADTTNNDLKFVQCTNAACSTKNTTTVDSTGNVGLHSSITIGSDGFARISYYDTTNGTLKFVQCTNAACSTKNTTTVDSTGTVGTYTSIAIGSDGFARISYNDYIFGDLKFVQCTNADCSTKNTTTVDSTGTVGDYTSIAINSTDGFARISYHDTTNAHLKFVQCTNADCSTKNTTTVDSTSGVGSYTSIAINSTDGFARISYSDTTNGDLKFVQCTNAACSTNNITTVDSAGTVGPFTSIAINSTDGFARISYSDATNGDLKFVQCTNAACSTNNITTVDSAGTVGQYTSLKLGLDGFARISYYDATNGDLKFVRLNSNSGVESLTGSALGSGSAFYSQLYVKGINTDAFTLSGISGAALFKNVQDSTSAFQVQNSASTNLVAIDTLGGVVNLGVTGSTSANSTAHIADSSAGVQTVSIGSTNSTSSTTISGGSSGVTLNAGSNAINLTGTTTIATSANNAGTIVKQTSGTATSGNVFDIQTANGTGHFLQVTNAAANEGNVTLQSVGATRDLTLDSASGTLKLGSSTTILQKSATALTLDVNNASDSTLTVTNAGSGIASLSVEGDVTVGTGRSVKSSGALTVTSGGSSALTLDSLSGTLALGSNTTTIQKSGTAFTVDLNNASDSTLTVTNAGSGIASLSVEGDVATGTGRVFKVGSTSGVATSCSSKQTLLNQTSVGGIVTGGSCSNATLSQMYTNGTGAADQTIQLSSAGGGGILVQDAASTVGTLFAVQKASAGASYFSVTNSTITMQDNSGNNAVLISLSGHELQVCSTASSYCATNYASVTADNTSATFKSNTGTTKIGSGTGDVTINAGASSAVNITGHATSVWQTDAGSLTIQGGTTLALLSTTSSAISLDSGSIGDVNVGTGSNAKTITIGNGTSTTSVAINCGTNGCTFGSNGTDHTTTIGSATGTSNTSLQCGTGTCGIGNNATDHTTTVGSTSGASASSLRSGTSGTTISSTTTTNNALTVSDTSLTSGAGIQLTLGNPQVNAGGGVLTTASAINVGSADHNYLSLTNRELTFGGHINKIGISNIQNTYVYDTSSDRDGGRWTTDERAKSSTWYNEAKDHNQAACVVGTDDRCGNSEFPNKALLVVAGGTGANTLYIFDATDNSLWMSFTQAVNTAMGVNANNTMSSVYALNGSIYVGTNGSASTGAYEINFVTDKITRYNATDAEDYSAPISQRNTVQTAAYSSQGRTGVKLVSSTVNDVHAQVINGKTFFAAANGNATATNGGIALINETSQTVANFGAANTNYQSIWLTSDDNLYALNSTLSQLGAFYSASGKSGNNNAVSTLYDETTSPALWPTTPSFNTNAPDALYVTNGTSDADGQSNTIYVSHNAGLSVIEEKVGAETGGAVKYYTTNMISEEIFGDGRTMLPMAGSGALTASTTITKGTDGDVSAKQVNFTTVACGANCPTHVSGVRGTALNFNGNASDYLCAGTTATCATSPANVDFTNNNFSVSFWVKTSGSPVSKFLIDKRAAAAGAGYNVQIDASGKLVSNTVGATGSIASSASTRAINDNAWHFVAITLNRPTNTTNCSGTNTCTLTQYIDGNADGSGTSTTQTTLTNTGSLYIGANSSGANNVAATFDEFTLTASVLSPSQVRFMYNVGSRALNNPNHAGASTIRGATVAVDSANKLNSTSVVKAVNPVIGNGLLYIGTTGGVAVVGIDTDSLVDLYTTSITSTDDVGGAYDTTNGNAINSVSIGKGFGTGNIVLLGYNNAGAGGIWSEISSTGLIDFLGNSYDPFGNNLTQTNLSVDRVFRVTNQISTRLDNMAMATTAMPQIYDLLRVDSNGLTLAPGSAILGTTIMKTTDISGNTNFSVRAMGTNFGSLVSGGAFEGKNSYWGQEYNIGNAGALNMVGSATPFACSWGRGDSGGHINGATAACGAAASASSGQGDMTISASLQSATTDACTPSQPTGANGVERITATSVNTVSHSAVCGEYPTGGAAGVSSNFLTATNLPVMAMKIKPSTLANNTGVRVFAGMWSGGIPAIATTIPGTAASTWGAYFTNCTATTPTCSNTGWQGWVVNGSTTLVGSVSCTGALSTTNFAYLRIEFRTATEVHFYADVNTSDGIQETECGSGVTSTSINTGAMTPFAEAINSNNATAATTVLDIDYMRTWQDDNVDIASVPQGASSPASEESAVNNVQSAAPLAPVTPNPEDTSNLFSFNAATSEDTVFNNDVYVHGTLFADKIKANQIEGLSVFTDQISSLQQKLASALDPKASAQTTSTSNQKDALPTTDSPINLSIPGSLSINGPAQFHGNVFFYKLVTFTEKTIFNNDVTFAAHVNTSGETPKTKLEVSAGAIATTDDNPDGNLAKATVTGNDSSGIFSLTTGDNSKDGDLLTIQFNKPFDKAPQIFLTPANKEAAQFKYYINSTPDGFKIVATDPIAPKTNLQFYYWVVQ